MPANAQVTPHLSTTDLTLTVGEVRQVEVFLEVGPDSSLNSWWLTAFPTGGQAYLFPAPTINSIWSPWQQFEFGGTSATGQVGIVPLGVLSYTGNFQGDMSVFLAFNFKQQPWEGINLPTGLAFPRLDIHVVPSPGSGVLLLGAVASAGFRRRR